MPHITETDVFRVRPSFVPFLFMIIGIGLLIGFIALMFFGVSLAIAAAVIAVGVFAIFIILLAFFTTQYALTTEKVHIRRGIIATYHEDIEVNRVSSIELHQGVIGRILNYGDIVIDGDSPNSRIIFKQIGGPRFRHEQIEHETLG